jgi:hypothetical protein
MGAPMKILERMDTWRLRAMAHKLALDYVEGSVPVGCRESEEDMCCPGCADFYAALCDAWNQGAVAALPDAGGGW